MNLSSLAETAGLRDRNRAAGRSTAWPTASWAGPSEGKYVHHRWKPEAKGMLNRHGKGIMARRTAFDLSEPVQATPAPIIAWLLGWRPGLGAGRGVPMAARPMECDWHEDGIRPSARAPIRPGNAAQPVSRPVESGSVPATGVKASQPGPVSDLLSARAAPGDAVPCQAA